MIKIIAIKKTKQVDKMMGQLQEVLHFFEEMKDSRQDAFDNKSEKWQEGEKGEEESENLSSLEDIVNELESTFSNIDNLFEE
jgi:hypothetical protein